jgi:hypothetical protein
MTLNLAQVVSSFRPTLIPDTFIVDDGNVRHHLHLSVLHYGALARGVTA